MKVIDVLISAIGYIITAMVIVFFIVISPAVDRAAEKELAESKVEWYL
jgi:hypothetical protein